MDEKQSNTVKMSGYLEKKGKKRMLSTWKQYWFVLKGGLLLYYRSQDEYETLSPCKGSINLGPPCAVKPCTSISFAFQIETRSCTITLRAECGLRQKKWIQCIMLVLNQNYQVHPKLNHFRYSLDEIVPKNESTDKKLERQNSMPSRSKKNTQILQRLQKLGAQSYGGSLGALRRSMGMSPNNNNNNLYECVKNADCVIAENSNYNHLPETRQSRNSLIITDNEQYWANTRVFKQQQQQNTTDYVEDVIYAEPQIVDNMGEENAYAIIRKSNESDCENLYEELEKYSNYYYEVPSCCNKKQQKEQKTQSAKPVKKSKSFIRKFWKKKDKKKADDDYYEIVKVEKVETEDPTIEMLSKLENTLKDKKVLVKKIMTERQKLPSTAVEPEQVPALPLKKSKRQTAEKTIDDILKDLEKESPRQQQQQQFPIEDVVLRNKDNKRFPGELGRLLDELAKVTVAPILTPGVTTSLVTTNLTDEEWLNLLPMRTRRYSEPDYDIPRSHKSLQRAEEPEPEILGTRFFGPVSLEKNDSSITPDSLEIDHENSYHSHHYYHFCKGAVSRGNEIYGNPTFYTNRHQQNNRNQEEVFCDSLEIN